MMPDYAPLEAKLNYTFSDPKLLQQALTHRSARGANNERFEFLGDALLGAIIAEALFLRQPQASEGQLSRIRSSLVKGDVLAEFAQFFELNKYIRLGSGEIKSGGRERRSILADAFEALIGAVYLDSDFQTTYQCVLNWYHNRFDNLADLTLEKDAKSRLQEWSQARGLPLPTYTVTVSGEPHEQIFDVTCVVEGLDYQTFGRCKSRRAAEQKAAQHFLERLDEQ